MCISAQPLFLFDGLAHRQLLPDALDGRGQKEKKVCVFPSKLACEEKATAINNRAQNEVSELPQVFSVFQTMPSN